MKPGDMVQVRQIDSAILDANAEPTHGVSFWLYAMVLQVLDNGSALVEVQHPGNREHGRQKLCVRDVDLRTDEDVVALHQAHPERQTMKLDLNRPDHRELNNLRVAMDRLKPALPEMQTAQ